MNRRALRSLLKHYGKVRGEINERLREFASFDRDNVERLFTELVFCICTPQTRARAAAKAVARLEEMGLLWNGDFEQISAILASSGVRFPNAKSKYIMASRVKAHILPELVRAGDGRNVRKALIPAFPGIGIKEASHFLRNIGFSDVAILDRHILRWMVRLGLLKSIPRSLTARRYILYEDKLFNLARKLGISPSALDLTIWSAETGEVFK